jgi:hypothetical protein
MRRLDAGPMGFGPSNTPYGPASGIPEPLGVPASPFVRFHVGCFDPKLPPNPHCWQSPLLDDARNGRFTHSPAVAQFSRGKQWLDGRSAFRRVHSLLSMTLLSVFVVVVQTTRGALAERRQRLVVAVMRLVAPAPG